MSESEKERSEIVVCGGDSDEDGGEQPNRRDDQKKKMEHRCEGGEGKVRKGKRVVLFRFRKLKQQLQRRSKRPSIPSSSSSSSTMGCSGKRVGRVGCYLCFKQPQSLNSPVVSQTSDPNNPEFSFELLKGLIEKNDFYSKECNTHIDVD